MILGDMGRRVVLDGGAQLREDRLIPLFKWRGKERIVRLNAMRLTDLWQEIPRGVIRAENQNSESYAD
jgi:hypothetical protein